MPGRVRPRYLVPSESHPSIESVIASSPNGAAIEVLGGHVEKLGILILDQSFEIEGPPDQSACLYVEQGIICAVRKRASDLILRNLTLRSACAPAVTVVGPCSIEFCSISSEDVGVQISVSDCNELPCLAQNTISGCQTGIHLAGGCNVLLDSNRLLDNAVGITVVGLELPEGSSDELRSLDRTQFVRNTKTDVQLLSLHIRDTDGRTHVVDNASEIALKSFHRACSIAARTDEGALTFRHDNGHTYAALSEPFEFNVVGLLPRRGRWCTSPFPKTEAGLRERRRDFARLVAPGGAGAFLVVGPGERPPEHWARRQSEDIAKRDVSSVAGDKAVAELTAWLEEAFMITGNNMQEGLQDSCIALLSAGEGVSFAMTYGLTPTLTQPHFVLFASPLGEVRIAWFVYVTDDIRPNAQSGRWLVILLTENLNAADLVKGSRGAWLRFAVSETDEPDMAQILARNTAALRRAADEGAWELVLAAE